MENIEKCPVCNEPLKDISQPCPSCSFEIHQTFFSSERFKKIEKQRKETHKKWWEQQEKRERDKDKEIENATTRITELEQILTTRDKELGSLRQELEDEKMKCSKLEDDNNALTEENSRLKLEVETQKVACAEKEKRIKELNDVIRQLQEEAEQLRNNVPIAYLIQKDHDEISNVYPIYKGNTIVGRNPHSSDNLANICTLEASCYEIHETHFSIQTSDDGSLIANRIADDWGIDYEGNNLESCPLLNSTIIFIGQQFQLIVVLV